ncbi:MAG: leucine-rich repeat domain-containing protein, partial [Clostridia bacterium]|nr:leucine-rich repeat domain-containing protein [Clostridia bacterium]
IPESVTVVEAAAFYGCSNLTNVKVGKGAKGYMDYAFGECNNLTNVYVTDIATWCLSERLGNFVAFGLKDKNLYCNDVLVTDLALPDDLVYVKDYAFAFGSITSVAIPDSTTSIAEGAFKGCNNLTNISVGENNAAYKDIAGNLYSKDGRTLLQYAVGNTATEFVISDSVQTIGGNAFNNAKSLTSVVIGTLVMKISRYAFNGCSNLKSVTFKNTVGWIYSSKNINVSSGTSGTSDFKELAEADIADAATAANYLTSKYIGYYWYR